MDPKSGHQATLSSHEPEWEPYIRAWRQRCLDEERNRDLAAKAAREAAKQAAAILVEMFCCTRVYLFGSLTGKSSAHFGARSDIDLAVEGLPIARYLTA
ncbi:MAG TPA: hypothetical protein VKT80_18065 [Chloroflexota bacterium]|nr:hypothetical protein [Chloroflexota bacterium]